MHTWTRNRGLSIAVAVGYVLAITAASLFHNHAAHDSGGCGHGHALAHTASTDCHHGASDKHSSLPNVPGQCPSDDGNCPVCHFLSQKPAPAAEVAAVSLGTLVQEVSTPSPASVIVGAFSAWQSRAPPAFA